MQPPLRVGRPTPSSDNVLVFGALITMQKKCLIDKIIKYNYDVSGLTNRKTVQHNAELST